MEDDKIDKTRQYNLSTKFFSECRNTLSSEEYLNLIEILKLYNSDKIGKENTLDKIQDMLKSHDKLCKDFKSIFTK